MFDDAHTARTRYVSFYESQDKSASDSMEAAIDLIHLGGVVRQASISEVLMQVVVAAYWWWQQ